MMNRSANFFIPNQKIIVGKIGSTYGISGQIRVTSYTEVTSNIFDYQPWLIKHAGLWKSIYIEEWKYHKNSIIIKIKNIDDESKASQLTNYKIVVEETKLPVLSKNNYYWKDLISCNVRTINGYKLGKIIDIMETGSNDVLIVQAGLRDAFGIKERLIPYIDRKVITQVNIDDKQIEVDWEPNF